MEFLKAKDELKKLARGKYHTIRYELTEFASGKLKAECELYIDSQISSSGKTWEEALNKMRIELGLDELNVDLSESPREEEGKEGETHPGV